jgi:hypothetical protein
LKGLRLQFQRGAESLALIAKAVICAITAVSLPKGDSSAGRLAHFVHAETERKGDVSYFPMTMITAFRSNSGDVLCPPWTCGDFQSFALNAFDVCSEADECSCRHRAWLYSNVGPDSAFGWRHVSGVSEGCTIMHCEVGFAASIVIDVATKNKNQKS